MKVAGEMPETAEEGRSSHDRVPCVPCQDDNSRTGAIGACRECEEYMCDTCFRHHLKAKLCRNHVLVAVGALPQAASKSSEDDIETCRTHNNEVIKFYCRTHEVVGCGDCMVLEHTACKPEYIQDLAKTLRKDEQFKQLFQKVDLMESFGKEIKVKVEKRKGEIDFLNEKVLKGIREFRSEMNAYLDKAEAEIMLEVKKVISENNEQCRKLEQDVREFIADIEDIKKKLDKQHHSGNVDFIYAVRCQSDIETIENTYEHVIQNNCFKRLEFVRGENMSEIVRSVHGFGRLRIESCKVNEEMTSRELKTTDFFVGTRVRRGRNWDYGNEDGDGQGTVIAFGSNGWAHVEWDSGGGDAYRIGQGNTFELSIIYQLFNIDEK